MGFFQRFREGFQSVMQASHLVSASLSLWLWLYVAVTLLSVASAVSPALAASSAVSRDPYLWSGRAIPWLEPLFFGASEHTWLGVSSIAALLLAWLFGLIVYAGVAGALYWRREKRDDEKRARGPFGSAGFKFLGTSLFYHVMLDLCLAAVVFACWLSARFASNWVAAVVGVLGLGWLGVLIFWRALALSVRVRGSAFGETFSSSISLIWRNPISLLGAMFPLLFNTLVLLVGMFLLLRYSFEGGWWLFLLQQLWVFAYLGHKLLLQATADVWAFPEARQ